MGVGIIYRNGIAKGLANGSLKVINVPELKEMGIKSMIAYDGRKPLSSITQEFLTLLRERAKRAKTLAALTANTAPKRRERKMSKRRQVAVKTARNDSRPHHPSVI